jgi:hypothetical protein
LAATLAAVIRENAKVNGRRFPEYEVRKISEERREAGRTARHDRLTPAPRLSGPRPALDKGAGALRGWIMVVEQG